MSDYIENQLKKDPTANYIAQEDEELGDNVDFFTKDELEHITHHNKPLKTSTDQKPIDKANDINNHHHHVDNHQQIHHHNHTHQDAHHMSR
ncbi:unnamed protein product [Cunninghamella blakesleeana]